MIKFGKMALDMFITKMYFFILDQIFLSINPFFQTSLSSKRCSYRSPSLTSKITKTFAMIAITITVNDIGCVHKSHTNLNSNTYSMIKAMIMIT